MEKITQLPSGSWTTRIRLPDGSRPRITHPLKSIVKKTATKSLADAARPDWITPADLATPLGEVWEKYSPDQEWESGTRDRYTSIWRVHVAPRWADVAIGEPDTATVTAWSAQMKRDKVSGVTRNLALTVLSVTFRMGVAATLRHDNPVRGVKRARRGATAARWYTPEEENAIITAADLLFPGRVDAGPFVCQLFDSGARYEDVAGTLRRNLHVGDLLVEYDGIVNRDGKRENTLKSDGEDDSIGTRWSVLQQRTVDRLAERFEQIGPNDLVYVSPGPKGSTEPSITGLRYNNWRRRVWEPTLKAARLCGGKLEDCDVREPDRNPHARRTPAYCQNADHGIPGPWPVHGTRHSFGERMGRAKLGETDVQSLMGHKDVRSTRRYMHAGLDRFEKARAAHATAHKPEKAAKKKDKKGKKAKKKGG